MKTTILNILAAFTAITTHAQLQLGIFTDYHNSYLYNKSDVAADDRLNYVATYKPAIGILLGYQINEKVSVSLSPQYFGAGQKFISPSPNFGLLKSIDDNIKLSYLQLPLQLDYHFGNSSNRIRQHISIGAFYSSLLSYKQNTNYNDYTITNINKLKANYTSYDGLNASSRGVFQSTSGADSSVIIPFKLSKKLFNSNDYGILLGYGVGFVINKNMSINANINFKYGFAQIDNTDSITAYTTTTPPQSSTYSINEVIYCRNNIANGLPNQTLRDPKSQQHIYRSSIIFYIYISFQKN